MKQLGPTSSDLLLKGSSENRLDTTPTHDTEDYRPTTRSQWINLDCEIIEYTQQSIWWCKYMFESVSDEISIIQIIRL